MHQSYLGSAEAAQLETLSSNVWSFGRLRKPARFRSGKQTTLPRH